jgi:hypothetical protein
MRWWKSCVRRCNFILVTLLHTYNHVNKHILSDATLYYYYYYFKHYIFRSEADNHLHHAFKYRTLKNKVRNVNNCKISQFVILSGVSSRCNCVVFSFNLQEPCVLYIGWAYRYPPDVAFYIFFSTNISTEYFKLAAHSPIFSSKCLCFHNAPFFGSCVIYILHTGCAKI